MPEEKKKSPDTPVATAKVKAPISETLERVVEKIEDADSILVTLSRDPSVDEMASAIALTLALDKLGKHTTAIYSGKTPNALEFLKPEETFETDTNSLQDFIIALDKEKADHLRYKIEGDFVKVYITPYKTTISEEDLEFSRGEINVDLIISLNVTSAEELDAALQEHGRILHDAVLINISNAIPGRIGGTEWNDNRASSIAEMIAQLLDAMKTDLTDEIATALLTGVVAATDRFSNEKTTPEVMAVSAKLMEKGADQQLIAANMTPKVEAVAQPQAEETAPDSIVADAETEQELDVQARQPEEESEKTREDSLSPEQELENMISGNMAASAAPSIANTTNSGSATNDLMQELVEAAKVEEQKQPEPEQQSSATVKESEIPSVDQVFTVQQDEPNVSNPTDSIVSSATNNAEQNVVSGEKQPVGQAEDPNLIAAVPTAKVPTEDVYGTASERTDFHDGTIDPVSEIEQPKDYGAMMEEALAEATPNVNVPEQQVIASSDQILQQMPQQQVPQQIPQQPTEQNVDDMVNQMVSQAQANNGAVNLPPPPAPPVDMNTMPPVVPTLPPVQQPLPQPQMTPEAVPATPIDSTVSATPVVTTAPTVPTVPAVPAVEQDPSAVSGIPTTPDGSQMQAAPMNPVVVQPVQDPASVPPVQDPGAFKIPGM